MRLRKHLNHRAFQAIRAGEKTVEIRANKARYDQPSFNTATPGDTVAFEDNDTGKTITCEIRRVTLYDSVRDLLTAEGTQQTLTSTDDIDEGVKSIHSIPGYEEYIRQNGVFAVRIKQIDG